ncbi:hypothetical protein CPC08DRAFT_768920 [Agrocybe pediades]|nr:hypothetical protein CPC08DRAFT_768920 [Agrocybe pediades]
MVLIPSPSFLRRFPTQISHLALGPHRRPPCSHTSRVVHLPCVASHPPPSPGIHRSAHCSTSAPITHRPRPPLAHRALPSPSASTVRPRPPPLTSPSTSSASPGTQVVGVWSTTHPHHSSSLATPHPPDPPVLDLAHPRPPDPLLDHPGLPVAVHPVVSRFTPTSRRSTDVRVVVAMGSSSSSALDIE